MDGPRTALHAEQRDSSAPGADKGQRWPDHDRLGQNRTRGGPDEITKPWAGGPVTEAKDPNWVMEPGAQAMRQLTPNEIRTDELTALLGWIEGPEEIDPPSRETIIRGLRDRISTLHPEQPPIEAEPPFPGLSFRQAAKDGIWINSDGRHILHGERIALGIELSSHQKDAYLIPPYQVDQLMAIADGAPSWPDVQHDTVQNEPTPPEAPRIGQLGELLEKVTKAQTDINRVGAVEAALQLIRLDLKYGSVSFLSDVDRTLLGSDLSDVLRGFLRA